MAYVTFNKNKSKSDILGLGSNAVEGKLYFTKDEEEYNRGIYLGTPSEGGVKEMANWTVMGTVFGEDASDQNYIALHTAAATEMLRLIRNLEKTVDGDSETLGLKSRVNTLEYTVAGKQNKVPRLGNSTTPVYVSEEGAFEVCSKSIPDAPGTLAYTSGAQSVPTNPDNLTENITLAAVAKSGKFSDLAEKPGQFSTTAAGLVPATGSGTTTQRFLCSDGSWREVSGGGGGGGTEVYLNGDTSMATTASIYAPTYTTGAGVTGQVLVSQGSGSNKEPKWFYLPQINGASATSVSAYEIYAPESSGQTGQILKANAGAAPTWINNPLPSNYSLPQNIGQSGQVLSTNSNADGTEWKTINTVPSTSGASDGQYLQYSSTNGLQWANVGAGAKPYDTISLQQGQFITSGYEYYVDLEPNKYYQITDFNTYDIAYQYVIYLDTTNLTNNTVNEYTCFFSPGNTGGIFNLYFKVGKHDSQTFKNVYMQSSITSYSSGSYYEVSIYVCVDGNGQILTPVKGIQDNGVAGVIKEWMMVS